MAKRRGNSLHRAFLRMYKEDSLREQEGRCLYCLNGLTYRKSTIEHKQARSNGGSDNRQNIGASCERCNFDKGSLSHSEYIKILDSTAINAQKVNRTSIWINRRLNRAIEKSVKKLNKYVKDLNDGASKSYG